MTTPEFSNLQGVDGLLALKLEEKKSRLTPALSPAKRRRGRSGLQRRNMLSHLQGAFTLVELLVALALMAVIIPVIYQALNVATLAGVVSQRKAMAARIADRVLNETILNGQTQSAQSGVEKSGPYEFRWNVKDEPWTQLGQQVTLNNPNGVNPTGVSQNNIHQISVDVTYTAQNRDFSVHLSTLVNLTATQ